MKTSFLIGIILIMTMNLYSQELINSDIRIYASGDNDYIKTNMFININRIDYNMTYIDFINKSKYNKHEKVLMNILKGLAKDNSFDSTLLNEIQLNTMKRGNKYIPPNIITKTLTIDCCFLLGKDLVYMITIKHPRNDKKKHRMAFYMENIEQPIWKSPFIARNKSEAISALIEMTFIKELENSNNLNFLNNKYKKEYNLSLISHKKNMVKLKFDGAIHNNKENILESSQILKSPILKCVQKCYLSLKNDTLDEYCSNFTNESAISIKKEYKALSPSEFKKRKSSALGDGKYISFVINADPIYIIYSSNKNPENNNRVYSRQYVIKEEDKYKVIGKGIQGRLEVLLDNYFQSILEKKIINIKE